MSIFQMKWISLTLLAWVLLVSEVPGIKARCRVQCGGEGCELQCPPGGTGEGGEGRSARHDHAQAMGSSQGRSAVNRFTDFSSRIKPSQSKRGSIPFFKSRRKNGNSTAKGGKRGLFIAQLNVDGLSAEKFEDVRNVAEKRKPDVIILLETKRRLEAFENPVDLPGYELAEARRSDVAGDKNGGGIAVYTRTCKGSHFHNPYHGCGQS